MGGALRRNPCGDEMLAPGVRRKQRRREPVLQDGGSLWFTHEGGTCLQRLTVVEGMDETCIDSYSPCVQLWHGISFTSLAINVRIVGPVGRVSFARVLRAIDLDGRGFNGP